MQLRAPAYPLITVDPYFSVWSPSNKLNESNTVHWTNSPNTFSGIATIDGKEYKVTDMPANTAFGIIEDCRIPEGYKMGWMIDSDADVVDIYNIIPSGAEMYLAPYATGDVLIPDEKLRYEGSKIYKGDARTVVVLIK